MTLESISFTRILVVLVLVQLVTYSVSAHELKKMTAGIRKKCLKEIGTTAEIVDNIEIGIFADDDPKVKCYFKCVLEKFNLFTKDGKLNFKLMKKTVPDHFRDIGSEMIDDCNHMAGPERCELAYEFMKCLYFANPVAFFVV